jgi:hypothetical protein
MQVEVWKTVDDEGEVACISVIPTSHTQEQRDAILGGDAEGDHILVRTIEAATWEDCMTRHHELMGWKPYVPMAPLSAEKTKRGV